MKNFAFTEENHLGAEFYESGLLKYELYLTTELIIYLMNDLVLY